MTDIISGIGHLMCPVCRQPLTLRRLTLRFKHIYGIITVSLDAQAPHGVRHLKHVFSTNVLVRSQLLTGTHIRPDNGYN